MKTNWSANNESLIFSGSGFLGYITPKANNKQVIYNVHFSEGGVGRETPTETFTNLSDAVNTIEYFFDLDFSSQTQKFNDKIENYLN